MDKQCYTYVYVDTEVNALQKRGEESILYPRARLPCHVAGERKRSRVTTEFSTTTTTTTTRWTRELAEQGRESFHALVSTEACCVNSLLTRGGKTRRRIRFWLLLCTIPHPPFPTLSSRFPSFFPESNYNQMTETRLYAYSENDERRATTRRGF